MAICFADFQCFFTTHAANKKLLDCHECPDLINIKADISEYAFLQSIFTKYKPRAIFHFAAESHVDRSNSSPGQIVKTNINCAYLLLQSALHFYETEVQNFIFVHISSDEVYGSLGPQDDAFHENSPYNPNSLYGASKAAADHLVSIF